MEGRNSKTYTGSLGGQTQLLYHQKVSLFPSYWLQLTWQSNTEEPENTVEGEKETKKQRLTFRLNKGACFTSPLRTFITVPLQNCFSFSASQEIDARDATMATRRKVPSKREVSSSSEKGGGEWRPDYPAENAPLLCWPPRPVAAVEYFVKWGGFLFPWHTFYALVSILVYFYATPPLDHFADIVSRPFWEGTVYVFVRNQILLWINNGFYYFILFQLRVQVTTLFSCSFYDSLKGNGKQVHQEMARGHNQQPIYIRKSSLRQHLLVQCIGGGVVDRLRSILPLLVGSRIFLLPVLLQSHGLPNLLPRYDDLCSSLAPFSLLCVSATTPTTTNLLTLSHLYRLGTQAYPLEAFIQAMSSCASS